MEISIAKTKVLHVKPLAELGAPAEEDYDSMWESRAKQGLKVVECEFCDRKFPSVAGCATHERLHCPLRHNVIQQWDVEEILDVRGKPDARFFRVKWKGNWSEEEGQQWVKESYLDAIKLVDLFWAHSGLDRSAEREVAGEWRCLQCGWITKKGNGPLKTHQKKAADKGGCKEKVVSRAGSRAEKVAARLMQEEAQSRLPKVFCEGEALENVLSFRYPGSEIQADGDEQLDPVRRMDLAKSAFFDLCHVWEASSVSVNLKLRIYAFGVISILTYGCEAWLLTDQLMGKLANWNARCLARITGREVHEEHRSPTFELIPRLPTRRAKWLGHVLRSKESHLVRRLVCAQADQLKGSYQQGHVLAEAPCHSSSAELVEMVADREIWREHTYSELPGGPGAKAKAGAKGKRSEAFMVANGYFWQNGTWIRHQEFEVQTAPQQQQQQ